MKAIIVADGDVGATAVPPAELMSSDTDGSPLVIAADGGARNAAALGLSPALVIGDGDSLSAADMADLRLRGTEVLLFPAGKDESDTELALREAIARGADDIVVLGALGGQRFDHALANVALLALHELDGRQVTIVDGATTVRLVGRMDGPGDAHIAGRPGDFVSLLPLDPTVEGIATIGLRYPLHGEALHVGPSRGLSNELTEPEARVTTARGRLLVVHTRSNPAEGGNERDDR